MLKTLKPVPLMAALLIATGAIAQETVETPPEETTTQQPGGELSMGREVEANQAYVKETYGDWELKCVAEPETEKEICQIYQLLMDSEAGNPIAEFSIFPLPAGSQAVAGANVIVPLGTLLSEELKIYVDIGVAKSYPFSFCTMGGCFARVGFTADDIASMKNGAVANIQLVPAQAPDQKVRIEASLTGFTEAFDAAVANAAE